MALGLVTAIGMEGVRWRSTSLARGKAFARRSMGCVLAEASGTFRDGVRGGAFVLVIDGRSRTEVRPVRIGARGTVGVGADQFSAAP